MSSKSLVYPPSPANVPASVTAPSAAFKKEVSKVMGAVLLFFIVYIILVLLAVGLAMATIYGGIALIIAEPAFITLMLGAGLIGLGIMVFIFLVKFIFAVSRFDDSGSVEITAADHPRLFEFIRQLTKETQIPFPKRIYLSPEVNAGVFYNSGFWSMFLPVKKNLQIGLGLVNTVNLSEFKAIMAHEFGHFSQRSMKLGSFVYNVNRVIYNMLFENTGYGRSLQSFANVSGYFAFFATITAHIVNGIQWILRKMYGLINKSYMSLSREMEFHADSVAASVSGSNNMIAALRRVDLAASFYNAVLEKCNDMYKQNKIIANLYPNQKILARHYAILWNLQMENEMPVVHDEFLATHHSRVNFKDQWASHPALTEREQHLRKLDVQVECCTDSAWDLFDNPESWQQQLTGKLYAKATLPENVQAIDAAAFENILQQDIAKNTLPEVYNGFYDSRQITKLDVRALTMNATGTPGFEELFSPAHASLYKKIKTTESDIQLLQAIAEKQVDIKTFDFDGEKYKRAQAADLVTGLQKELGAMQQQLEEADRNAFLFFYNKAGDKAGQLKDGYVAHFHLREQADLFYKHANDMLTQLQPLYAGNLQVSEVNTIIDRLKTDETTFKGQLRNWLGDGAFSENESLAAQVHKFLDSNYAYFTGSTFFNHELDELHTLAGDCWEQINDLIFRKFKVLLEFQAQLID